MSGARTVQVLLVEDNDVDREAVRRAFRQHRIANPIVAARDGIEALGLLRGERQPKLPRPYIVLLDLNMPRMDGIELLRAIRADRAMHDSVVFVLTTSKADEDKMAAYDLNVAGYICKSDVGTGFIRLVELLDRYWRLVELPGREP
ncbi:MAG: response regulator [Sandaracinaceae bacterium]|nr:response regulator [Sandaracinaceae bacterium]